MARVAASLEEVVEVFDPRQPLISRELEIYYVSRDRSPVQRLAKVLQDTRKSPTKVLFAGHRGSGKSTELARLCGIADETFFVTTFTVEGNLDLSAVDYIQVVFALAKSIYESARAAKIHLPDDFLAEIHAWFSDTMAEVSHELRHNEGADVQLDAFFVKLGGKLGTEVTTRQALKQRLEPRISDLISIVDRLCEVVSDTSGRPILAVIDGLDKPDLAVARPIFVEHSFALAAPKCQIVYTVPLSLLYSSDYSSVRQGFTTYLLPNVPLTNLDGAPYRRGLQMLRDLVLARMDSDLLSKAAIDELIRASGGLLRELVQLVQSSATYSLAEGDDKITVRAVRQACQEVTQNFRRILRPAHYHELNTIGRLPSQQPINEVGVQLIENGSLLEYEAAGASWFGTHPMVHPLLLDVPTLEV